MSLSLDIRTLASKICTYIEEFDPYEYMDRVDDAEGFLNETYSLLAKSPDVVYDYLVDILEEENYDELKLLIKEVKTNYVKKCLG